MGCAPVLAVGCCFYILFLLSRTWGWWCSGRGSSSDARRARSSLHVSTRSFLLPYTRMPHILITSGQHKHSHWNWKVWKEPPLPTRTFFGARLGESYPQTPRSEHPLEPPPLLRTPSENPFPFKTHKQPSKNPSENLLQSPSQILETPFSEPFLEAQVVTPTPYACTHHGMVASQWDQHPNKEEGLAKPMLGTAIRSSHLEFATWLCTPKSLLVVMRHSHRCTCV